MIETKQIAKSYFKLLTSLDWEDEILIYGLNEGLNKFLSNAFLRTNGGNKYLQGDFFSEEAIKKIDKRDFSQLVYEHMVPKSKYIQKPCEELAKNGGLTIAYIENLLDSYWKIAIITKSENSKLTAREMPKNWDGKDIQARYRAVNINLIEMSYLK